MTAHRKQGLKIGQKFDGKLYLYSGYVIGVRDAKKRAKALRGMGYLVRVTTPRGVGGQPAENIREIWTRKGPSWKPSPLAR